MVITMVLFYLEVCKYVALTISIIDNTINRY